MPDQEQTIVNRLDREGYSILTLNRPERRNALSRDLIQALSSHLEAISKDASVKAVIITGNGKAFCAGGDLAGGMMTDGGVVGAHEDRAAFGALLKHMRGHPAIVAAVNGDALAEVWVWLRVGFLSWTFCAVWHT